MARMRLRLWTLLVAVAVLAVPLGMVAGQLRARKVSRLRALSSGYRKTVNLHAGEALRSRRNLDSARYQAAWTKRRSDWARANRDVEAADWLAFSSTRFQSTIQHETKMLAWHRQLEKKYDRAARRPWEPVEPDPPPPFRTKAPTQSGSILMPYPGPGKLARLSRKQDSDAKPKDRHPPEPSATINRLEDHAAGPGA